MKWIPLALAALLLPGCRIHHHSDYACVDSVQISPSPGQVPSDAQWLVIEKNRQSMGIDGADIGGLALRGPEGDVPLLVHRYYGESFTEAVVAPKSPLQAGSKVTLELRNPRSRENAFASLSERDRTWTVASTPTRPPRWLGPPSIDEQSCNWLRRKLKNCPPQYINLRLPIDPADGARVRVRVEGGRDGAQEAILLSRADSDPGEPATVTLAEFYACGGPLRLTEGAHYRIQVSLLDVSGQEIPAPGGPLDVVGL